MKRDNSSEIQASELDFVSARFNNHFHPSDALHPSQMVLLLSPDRLHPRHPESARPCIGRPIAWKVDKLILLILTLAGSNPLADQSRRTENWLFWELDMRNSFAGRSRIRLP